MPEKFLNFLNYSVFEFNERSFTVIELLAVPLWLLLSIWVAHLGVKFVGGKLKGNYKDPNLVHLIERILYVIAFTSIFLTTLSMLNVPITAFAFLSGAVAIGIWSSKYNQQLHQWLDSNGGKANKNR